MIYHLNGTVTDMEPGLAVIECGGVGFGVQVTANTLSQLHRGESAKLYICEQVREDAFELFGFGELGEKRCFEMLISVSGVGPKVAMAILSAASPEKLCMAIVSGDEKALTAAPGVGKRLAQRIILELKDKMEKQAVGLGGSAAAVPGVDSQAKLADVMSALTVLGYSRSECTQAIQGLDMSRPLDELIRAALRNMMN